MPFYFFFGFIYFFESKTNINSIEFKTKWIIVKEDHYIRFDIDKTSQIMRRIILFFLKR